MVDEKIIESFHALWNNHPSMVRLIKKDRTVVAVNTAAAAAGFNAGVKCFETGGGGAHAGCLANKALSENKGITQLSEDGRIVRYWLPVEGYEDLFVHYLVMVSSLLPPAEAE